MPVAPNGTQHFHEVFRHAPDIATRAPGRINVIGEHVDYQGGLVLPAAIDRHVFAHARATDTSSVRLWSHEIGGQPLAIPLDNDKPLSGEAFWANYVFGVIAMYRDAGHPVAGMDIAFEATLAPGAGLSSSAALEASTALAVEGIGRFGLPPVERALLCQKADHEYVGVPCGIMDQLAVNAGVEGHLLEIDCRSLGISPTRLPNELSLVTVDSRIKHSHAGGEYGARRHDCESAAAILGTESLRDASLAQVDQAQHQLGDRLHRRARHVVTEIERVREFSRTLQSGDVTRAGSRLTASHASLRDDFEVSCPELDDLVALACELGAIGARMTGGGFGGSTINLVHASDADTFADKICTRYAQKHGREIEAFVVQPTAGATIL